MASKFTHICKYDKYIDDYPHLYKVGGSNANVTKNRYEDIVAPDDTLVTLSNGRYINANMIYGKYSPQRFIMTQAPMDNTIDDFYQMIFDHNVSVIVCLTQCVESGVTKAIPYWTDSTSSWQIKCVSIINNNDFIHRSLQVTNILSDVTKSIELIQYTPWIDRMIPEKFSLYELIMYVNQLSSDSPIIVHCSAGIGRTGTFIIAYNYFINGCDDIDNAIIWLKQQRAGSVQTESQYKFLHEFCVKKLNL